MLARSTSTRRAAPSCSRTTTSPADATTLGGSGCASSSGGCAPPGHSARLGAGPWQQVLVETRTRGRSRALAARVPARPVDRAGRLAGALKVRGSRARRHGARADSLARKHGHRAHRIEAAVPPVEALLAARAGFARGAYEAARLAASRPARPPAPLPHRGQHERRARASSSARERLRRRATLVAVALALSFEFGVALLERAQGARRRRDRALAGGAFGIALPLVCYFLVGRACARLEPARGGPAAGSSRPRPTRVGARPGAATGAPGRRVRGHQRPVGRAAHARPRRPEVFGGRLGQRLDRHGFGSWPTSRRSWGRRRWADAGRGRAWLLVADFLLGAERFVLGVSVAKRPHSQPARRQPPCSSYRKWRRSPPCWASASRCCGWARYALNAEAARRSSGAS